MNFCSYTVEPKTHTKETLIFFKKHFDVQTSISSLSRLKEEIRELENKGKIQEKRLQEEQRRSSDAEQRWTEAEKEIKELHVMIEDFNKVMRNFETVVRKSTYTFLRVTQHLA